ncbi:MAG: hypothetical protein M3Q75_05665 [Gemmatimonadota bacterium]|nr:hypothetical protein [Gemmatimonadota bacterium]
MQTAREADRESIFAEMAAARGIDISAMKQDQANQPPANDAASRIASAGELRGTPPTGPDRLQGLEGRQLLEAEYARQESQR